MAGRGQSGLRLWKKAAIVKPVDPSPDKHGVKQPAYLRSHSAMQTSKKLNDYKSYIRKNMQGHTYGSRALVQKRLTALAHRWKAGHGGEVAAGEDDYSENDDEIFWE